MSYEEKIQRAKQVIEEHNQKVSEMHPKWHLVDWKVFLDALVTSGGTSDTALKECSWEDLEKMRIPKLLAKIIAKIFREGENTRSIRNTGGLLTYPNFARIDPRSNVKMEIHDILYHYVPDRQDRIFERLAELSKGLPCLIFDSDGKFDHANSTENIFKIFCGEELKTPNRLYRIGERPSLFGSITEESVVEALAGEKYEAHDLLGLYDPERQDAVFHRLKEMSKGLPCLIYNESGRLDLVLSGNQISLISKGQKFENSRELFRIGEKPKPQEKTE